MLHPTKAQTRRTMSELIVCPERLSSVIKTENDTKCFNDEENNIPFMEKNHTEVNLSLKKLPFTAEITSVKRPFDDCDNRTTANKLDRDLDQKTTIKMDSYIKSEESDFTDCQYFISPEEVNIKSEDDADQSDTQFENHTLGDKPMDRIKMYKCPECSFQTKHKSNVKRHSILHKNPEEMVWHRCTECAYKSCRKGCLKKHALIHNKTWQFDTLKCAHCVYETSKKESLKDHLRVRHREDIPWMHCPELECPYKTRRKANLKLHFLVHSNDKFFKCTQCPYQSKHRFTLKKHQQNKHERIHKWHACPQCPFKTTRKNNLKIHVRSHAKPEWYMCELCPYKTRRKSLLNKHDAKNHKPADRTAVPGMLVQNSPNKTSESAPTAAHRHCRVVPLFRLWIQSELEALPSVPHENASTE